MYDFFFLKALSIGVESGCLLPMQPTEIPPDGAQEANAGNHLPVLSITVSVEDQDTALVNRMVIHDDKAVENLPRLQFSDHQLVGSFVGFHACIKDPSEVNRVECFTALVKDINASCITFMEVRRFSRSDWYTHRGTWYISVEEGVEDDTEGTTSPLTSISAVGVQRHIEFIGVDGQRSVIHGGGAAGSSSAALPRESVEGYTNPFWADIVPGEIERELEDRMRTPPPSPSSSAGVLQRRAPRRDLRSAMLYPYMTIQRQRILKIEVGHNPGIRSSVLFDTPSRRFDDLQYLRMFVRRYLVHISTIDDAAVMPLLSYIGHQCNWPGADRDVVHRIAKEELRNVLTTERALRRSLSNQKEILDRVRAPPGFFSNTGILFFTKLPQSTAYLGIMVLLMSVAEGIYLYLLSVEFCTPVICTIVQTYLPLGLLSLACMTLAGIFITVHGVRMRVPVLKEWALVLLRFTFSVIGGGVGLITGILYLVAMRESQIEYLLASEVHSDSLCQFYSGFQCSGFKVSCKHPAAPPALCRCSTIFSPYSTNPCRPLILVQLGFSFIPIALLAFMHAGLFIYSYILLKRLCDISDSIRRGYFAAV